MESLAKANPDEGVGGAAVGEEPEPANKGMEEMVRVSGTRGTDKESMKKIFSRLWINHTGRLKKQRNLDMLG